MYSSVIGDYYLEILSQNLRKGFRIEELKKITGINHGKTLNNRIIDDMRKENGDLSIFYYNDGKYVVIHPECVKQNGQNYSSFLPCFPDKCDKCKVEIKPEPHIMPKEEPILQQKPKGIKRRMKALEAIKQIESGEIKKIYELEILEFDKIK